VTAARVVLPRQAGELVGDQPRAIDDVGAGGADLAGQLQGILDARVGRMGQTRADQRVGRSPADGLDDVLAVLEVAAPSDDYVDASLFGRPRGPFVEHGGQDDPPLAFESHEIGDG